MGKTADRLRYALTGGSFRTEIHGSDRVILEGCDGIIAYETDRVGFRCGRQQVWVTGKDLRMMCVEEDGAVVTGRIEEVCFR